MPTLYIQFYEMHGQNCSHESLFTQNYLSKHNHGYTERIQDESGSLHREKQIQTNDCGI